VMPSQDPEVSRNQSYSRRYHSPRLSITGHGKGLGAHSAKRLTYFSQILDYSGFLPLSTDAGPLTAVVPPFCSETEAELGPPW
jgi:hypothetical protein